jgi:Ca2+-dependent lipid-binding protein
VKDNSSDCSWDENFVFPVRDTTKDILYILLKDSDLGAFSEDDAISRGKVPLSTLKLGQRWDSWMDLEPIAKGKKGGSVRIWLLLAEDGAPRGW